MIQTVLVVLAIALFARRRRGSGVGSDALASMLGGAETAGIITAAQRTQLLEYAATHAAGSARLGGAAWLGVFAGLFVVAGVSLLIARNWDEIGPLVRIGAFLAALLVVGEAAIRLRDRSVGVSVPLELLWFFLPLLGIGLYGQTFQLTGDPLQPFLVWLALTAPLAWASPRPVVATIHTAAMAALVFCGNYLVDPASMLLAGGVARPVGMLTLTEHGGGPLAWTLSVALLALVGVQSLRLLPRHHRHHFVGIWVLWILSLLIAPTALHLDHEGWLVLATVALTTLWVIVLVWLDASLEERSASVLAWLGTLYALSFTWHIPDAAEGSTSALGITVVEIAVAGALAALTLVPAARLSPHRTWAWAAKGILGVPILITMLYLTGDPAHVWLAGAGMNVVLVVVAVGLMWHGSLVREPAQVNLGVLVLVAMLITRFLDVFGSMLRSGIGFIVAGLLLAGLSWALERTRRRLIGVPNEVPR